MSGAAGRPLVLVADDDAGVREVITEYLTVHGFAVVEAENGLETLLQVKRARPGAVVLDIRMPRLGGLEALKHIRAFDPAVVVVVVTGNADEFRDSALELGAVAVLPKPLVLADLAAALRTSSAPAAPPTSRAAAPAPPAAPAAGARQAAPRVLIVDDDAEVRAVLEDLLAARGYEVQAAADGAAALRMIAREAPDLVLLDMVMPGLSGVDTLPAVRALAPTAPVIMVSGEADVEAARAALARGAFDYVTKPVDMAVLARVLDTALLLRPGG